jgi:hypothetical protein
MVAAAPQAPRDPRALGAAIGHRLKAQPISPESAAKVAALVMSGVPQKRSGEKATGSAA